MGEILNKTVSRAVAKGYIPASEQQAVINRINGLAAKYQFSADDFAIFSMMETDGLDPKAWNGNCAGIIQFCGGTGAATVGYSDAYSIRQLSTLKQLDLVDKYFAAQGLPKGASLEDLYLTVLYPAGRSVKDPNANLGVPGQQAASLYNSNGVITKNSLRQGLLRNASARLGMPVDGTSSSLPPAGGSGLPGDYSSSNSGGSSAGGSSALAGVKSAVFAGDNCPPPPFTQQDRIIYTGCQSKISSAVNGGGMGSGATAPAIASTGTAEPGVGDKAYEGQLKPGGFILPCKGEITSKFGSRWGKLHAGWDIANSQGTPIYAAADGVVKYIINGCTQRNRGAGAGDECGGGGYGNQVGIDHAGGLFTRYTHMTTVTVKAGDRVKQGQQVGTMGSTGGSTGDHTHFEIRKGEYGTPLDPANYLKG